MKQTSIDKSEEKRLIGAEFSRGMRSGEHFCRLIYERYVAVKGMEGINNDF